MDRQYIGTMSKKEIAIYLIIKCRWDILIALAAATFGWGLGYKF